MNLLDLWQHALQTIVMVTGPFLVTALVVGIATSLLQAATQLQENVISFVPKIAATGVILVLAGRWVLEQMVRYSDQAINALAVIAKGTGT